MLSRISLIENGHNVVLQRLRSWFDAAVLQKKTGGATVKEDIEVPRRGYDTKDVETMNKALDVSEGGGSKRVFVVLVLIIAIGAAVWMIAGR